MKIYIPVREYETLPELKSCSKEFSRLIKELPYFNNDPKLIQILDQNESGKYVMQAISFSFMEWDDPLLKKLNRKNPSFYIEYIHCFMVVEVKFEADFKGINFGAYYAKSYLSRLLLLLNLAYGTPIVFLTALVYDKKRYLGETHYLGGEFDFAYLQMDELKWPKLKKLKLEQTLEWLLSNEINLFTKSNSPASRAVNAYSHLFSYELNETNSASLFWCMLGIEALFAKGNNGILEQIRSKTKLVLGEPKEFKKKLTKLYEYRSRLIHGDYDFPAKFSRDIERFDEEYWDYSSFATAILLAGIKMLIHQNKAGYDFELKWKK